MVLYWYQSHGRVIAGEMEAKFYLIADSIRQHRSDTSLVRVVVPFPSNHQAEAEKAGVDFVKAIYPQLVSYLPR